MLLKIIDQEIGHRRYTALCFGRVRLIQRRLAAQRDAVLTGAGYLQRKTHACHAAANNQKIKFMYHLFMYHLVIYHLVIYLAIWSFYCALHNAKTLIVAPRKARMACRHERIVSPVVIRSSTTNIRWW